MSDAALRARLRAQLRTTGPSLLNYFERRLDVRDDAADLLAETMLQAWRRVNDMPQDEPSQERAWLYGIAAHVLANDRRAKNRRRRLALRLWAHIATEPATLQSDELFAVRDAVSRLQEPERELVILVHWDGLSLAEAATVLHLNPSTARGRYAAARKQLREALTLTTAPRHAAAQ